MGYGVCYCNYDNENLTSMFNIWRKFKVLCRVTTVSILTTSVKITGMGTTFKSQKREAILFLLEKDELHLLHYIQYLDWN